MLLPVVFENGGTMLGDPSAIKLCHVVREIQGDGSRCFRSLVIPQREGGPAVFECQIICVLRTEGKTMHKDILAPGASSKDNAQKGFPRMGGRRNWLASTTAA